MPFGLVDPGRKAGIANGRPPNTHLTKLIPGSMAYTFFKAASSTDTCICRKRG